MKFFKVNITKYQNNGISITQDAVSYFWSSLQVFNVYKYDTEIVANNLVIQVTLGCLFDLLWPYLSLGWLVVHTSLHTFKAKGKCTLDCILCLRGTILQTDIKWATWIIKWPWYATCISLLDWRDLCQGSLSALPGILLGVMPSYPPPPIFITSNLAQFSLVSTTIFKFYKYKQIISKSCCQDVLFLYYCLLFECIFFFFFVPSVFFWEFNYQNPALGFNATTQSSIPRTSPGDAAIV